MAVRPSPRGVALKFKNLGPRTQVALCQLPLSLIVTVLGVMTPFGWPSLLSSPLYLAGLALHAALFLACFLTPWERLRQSAYLIIPVLDLLAVGLLRNGAAPLLPGLAILVVFPVIWLAASGMLVRTSVVLSAVGPLLIMVPSTAPKLPNLTAADVTVLVLFPLVMLAVSLAIRFASVNMRVQHRELQAMGQELRELLAASREREKLLVTILDATDVGIIAVDSIGNQLLANNMMRRWQQTATPAGVVPADHSQQRVFAQDKVTPLPPDKRPLRRAIEGESFADYLVWIGDAPQQRAVSTAARPLMDDAGRLTGAVVVYNDVTGLVEAMAANEELVANVSHEFRSPLNSILGNIDLVLEDSDGMPALTVRRLGVVQRNSERLLALVSDLTLEASAALNVHPKRTDISGLVETSIGSAQAQAERADVALVADVPSPLWAYADPLRIGQALDNLVSNAIKYSPDGGTVTISAAGTEDWVKLVIQDTGMGMAPEDAAKVFSRFFRAESARDAAIPGAGLGLAITKTILERHGGKISCDSKPGMGSTFTLTLPAEGYSPSF
ncbi:ATP-binding protein [Pseudarthrobacter sp. AL07]|uniref:sensor histidine kinase n=1 Tax=Pseudarthrobacter sp. AL07 TaxID=3042233 RepID=UPI00249A4F5F|nr:MULTISPECIES: PAS domain-containing sensor histidine kinase [unclassified Pseudarthrobacter]MDI3193753.1 ATP-binding protein [Pseudarthrobacter sp. AL20]MDI3207737.1 ATP-binding protein [Pseudarthrobacter sp. AL07]